MGKYRMRPVEKEAWPISDVLDAANKSLSLDPRIRDAFADGQLVAFVSTLDVETAEGTMTGHRGDYLVLGINGEWYPVMRDVFEKSYERID